MKKRFGIVSLLAAMLAGSMSRPEGVTEPELHERKRQLLTNGGAAPIPRRMLNQRQKRKRARQANRY